MEKSVPRQNTESHALYGGDTIHLDAQQQAILNRQLFGLPAGPHGSLLAYATPLNVVAIIISCIAAIVAGALNPLLTVIYGQLVGAFQGFSSGTVSGPELQSRISKFTLYFVYLAIGEFVSVYIATVGFYHTGEHIVRRLRRGYLEAIIRQNMAFFDILGAGEVTTCITADMNLIQEGITSKISLSLTAAATFITAFVIAFVEYWKLALILSSTVVAMVLAGATGAAYAVKYTQRSLESYSRGATVAEEAISSIRHVAAFGIQEEMAVRYFAHLTKAEKSGIKAKFSVAIMVAIMNGLPYLSYGLSFWQGSRVLVEGDIDGAGVVTTTLAIVIGAFAIGRVAPNFQAFISSVASMSSILKAMARQSSQDPMSSSGIEPQTLIGDITIDDIDLVYPSRTDIAVLNGVRFQIPAMMTTAIVGASGCGKSSIVGLIERFYEPTKGRILLDGRDIQSLNLTWLRCQISFVGQEPILFSTTIFENIKHGLANSTAKSNDSAMAELVAQAARKANAHDFILALPLGYQTEVGERGLQLSGGQRQRIAIARALISDPKILLLDEATSALDVKSERAVQSVLELAANGRTTVVIAHRLSTIRNADKIVVMSEGQVVEQGNHEELMKQNRVYAKMVRKQQIPDSKADDKEESPTYMTPKRDLTRDDIERVEISRLNSSEFSPPDLEKGGDISLEQEGDSAQSHKFSFWNLAVFIAELNRKELRLVLLGLSCSVVAGLATPVQSIFFAKLVDTLSLPSSSYKQLRSTTDFWSLMYLMLGIATFTAWLGQGICFSLSQERLIRRARDLSFRSILRQNVGYFDEKQHSTGALTALLSTGTANLTSLDGAVLGAILTFVATLAGGIILSLIIGWKLALVCSATIPIVAGCGWVRLKMLALFDEKVRKTHEDAASYASEAVTAIRTVASLSLEHHVLDHYSSILSQRAAKSLRSILQASSLYAASQSCVFLCAALGFWYGGTLISSHEYTLLQFFICFAALISGSQVAGAVFSFAPDMSKALHAGRDLRELFERRSNIDANSNVGEQIETCAGRLDIENVSFRYPTRPERLVLDDFSISIQPGQYIALVGSSGCGKSTIISLLERFFDPTAGRIRVDGKDLSKLNVSDYRRLVSLVGQEPTLYMGTIKDNLVLGSKPDVSEEAIAQACREANIYEFIMTLPDGFSTVVGSRGNLLSGGQKQRIAIARALLRNTRILLLDEATSALDSESEKLVQDALDKAAKHRTTIAVAHRLSTIQKADRICVLEQGRLAESGTHAELMAKRASYFELVKMQNLQEIA